jgi:hypothetical protein
LSGRSWAVPPKRRLLTDPERITRELDEAIAREEANHRNPDDAAAFWTSRINDLARLRAKNQEMYRVEAMTLDELKAETARLEEERAMAEEELAHARDAGQRLTELRTHREEVFRMLQTSLALGLMWFPPHLRRQVYEALGLRATIHPGGPLGSPATARTSQWRAGWMLAPGATPRSSHSSRGGSLRSTNDCRSVPRTTHRRACRREWSAWNRSSDGFPGCALTDRAPSHTAEFVSASHRVRRVQISSTSERFEGGRHDR